MIPIPTKVPIVIISSPRTGSNALAHYYSTKYKLAEFSEPDANDAIQNSTIGSDLEHSNLSVSSFLEFIKTSDLYVVKIQSLHLLQFYPLDYVLHLKSQYAFRIKLQRRDVAAQVVSNYLAWKRKLFHYVSGQQYDFPDQIEIDMPEIDRQIVSMNSYNTAAYAKLDFKFDAELYYEDFAELGLGGSVKTPLPSNYEELLQTIRKRIDHVN